MKSSLNINYNITIILLLKKEKTKKEREKQRLILCRIKSLVTEIVTHFLILLDLVFEYK